jgi:MFS family permease
MLWVEPQGAQMARPGADAKGSVGEGAVAGERAARWRWAPSSPLWRNADFLALWQAQTVSAIGSEITRLALPLTAVLTLQATAFEMGVLRAAANAPILLLGLIAGVWVDRLRRRPIMVAADLGRALLLGAIPAIALLGALRIEHLWLVALLVGALTVFFDLAVTSIPPTLVAREELVEANSKLQLSGSTAAAIGPGLAGWLTALLTAPLAIAIDAVSFLASAALLMRIGAAEPAPRVARRPMWGEIVEGARFLFGHPVLRPLTVSTAVGSLGGSIQWTVLVLYAVQQLGLAPALIGLVIASGGVAAILGAALAGPAARRYGPGPAIIGGGLAIGLGGLALPAAAGPPALATAALVIGQLLIGRVNASRRVLVFGVAPIGALLAGVLGETVGLRPTLLVGAAVELLAFVIALRSPLRDLREQPREAAGASG